MVAGRPTGRPEGAYACVCCHCCCFYFKIERVAAYASLVTLVRRNRVLIVAASRSAEKKLRPATSDTNVVLDFTE